MIETYIHNINEALENYFGVKLTREGILKFLEFKDAYGIDEVEQSVFIACEQYGDIMTVFWKLPGILENRRRMKRYYTEK